MGAPTVKALKKPRRHAVPSGNRQVLKTQGPSLDAKKTVRDGRKQRRDKFDAFLRLVVEPTHLKNITVVKMGIFPK